MTICLSNVSPAWAERKCSAIFFGSMIMSRARLPDRRRSETFEFEVPTGTTMLRYTATIGFFADGSIGELFLNNHKSNSTADTNARDAAIAFSFAIQHGADIEDIRKACCRETNGRASGPLGMALDLLVAANKDQ
jgi:hypothetical protein